MVMTALLKLAYQGSHPTSGLDELTGLGKPALTMGSPRCVFRKLKEFVISSGLSDENCGVTTILETRLVRCDLSYADALVRLNIFIVELQ